jgi:hypothetical protein
MDAGSNCPSTPKGRTRWRMMTTTCTGSNSTPFRGESPKGVELPFGRADAIDQARGIQALIKSSEIAAPVQLS